MVYSHAVKVGNLIYVSGQVALDFETGEFVGTDIETQTAKAFENLNYVLKEAGATLDDVVKLNIYITGSIESYSKVREIRKRFFPKEFPAATGFIVKSLLRKEALVEIDAIAIKE